MSIAHHLAENVCSMRYENLPPAAIHWAKTCIADTVGVMLAGSGEDAPRFAEQTLAPSEGNCLIVGSRRRVKALDAALINGTAVHALDYDDSNHTMGGHPSGSLVSSLFALGEERAVPGRAILTAYVTGYEVDARIGMSVNFYHYTKGWHPTATLGIFGTTAACSKLLDLTPAKTATAIAIAASFASGIKANFGTMMKPLHVGRCARDGIFAAMLAQQGFTANAEGAFEHEHGFFNVFNGEGTYDSSKVLLNWASPLNIVDPGVTIKRHPCCGSTHAAIDAVLILARQHDLKAADVKRIDVQIHSRRLAHTNRPAPKSTLDAKFSIQYCLARALNNRRIILEYFEGSSFLDPDIKHMMDRVYAKPYADAAANPHGAHIEITMNDGSIYTGQVDERDALSPEMLAEKFVNCAMRVGPRDTATQLHSTLANFEALDDVRRLTAQLEAHASN